MSQSTCFVKFAVALPVLVLLWCPLRGLAGWAAEAACSGSSQLHFMRGASSSSSVRSDSCVGITYTNAHNPFHKPLHRAASSKDACTPAHIHFPLAVARTHEPTVSIADTTVHRAQSKKFWRNFWWHTRVNTHTCTGSGFFRAPSTRNAKHSSRKRSRSRPRSPLQQSEHDAHTCQDVLAHSFCTTESPNKSLITSRSIMVWHQSFSDDRSPELQVGFANGNASTKGLA